MKRRISWLALVMAVMMLFAACGTNKEGTSGSIDTAKTSTESAAAAKESGPPAELTMAMLTFGNTPKDMQLVEDEINKIALEKINAKIKVTPIGIGAWSQQMNLMLSSGEKLDMLSSLGRYFGGYVAKGQLIPLDDLLAKHGQGIVQAIGQDYLKAGKVNGKIYGLTTLRDLGISEGLIMRKDIVEKYQIDVKKIKTLDDVETVFKTVKEKEPNITPLIPGVAAPTTIVDVITDNDGLGDGFGVLLNRGAELKVVNWYETPQYADLLKKLRSWYNAGYIMKDIATNKESAANLIKANKGYFYFGRLKPGVDNQESRMTGTPMVVVEVVPPFTNTSIVQTVQWAIARNSQKPEKAMQFLNLMYTDAGVQNLLSWGIEGKHYVKVDGGVIDYPQGVDAKNTGYGLNMGWVTGNQFITHVWKGDSPDLWKYMAEFNAKAVKSKALGFTFDQSNVKTEIAALTTVTDQYKVGLETGTLDPEKVLPEFISKLETAGIDKVIAEKQKQLDEWAKNNK